MAALGDRFEQLRTGAIAIPIVVAFVMAALWLWRRPLASGFYLFGLAPLAIAVAMTFLPRVDSGYEQVYWLGDQEYRIPWQFEPFNGHDQPGGESFLVRVRGTELSPYHEPGDYRAKDHFTLAKSTAINTGEGALPPEESCVTDNGNLRCEWQRGDYVYGISGNGGTAPPRPQMLFQPVEDLFNSFKVGKAASAKHLSLTALKSATP